jgi:alcohol dehydrogenase (cytochrome c)
VTTGFNIQAARAPLPSGRRVRMLMTAAGAGLLATPVHAADPAATPIDGDAAYQANCAACHGQSLAGGFGPSLNNAAFRIKWGPKDISAMRAYIASAMPPANPGGLSAATYAAIADFIAHADGLGHGSSATPGLANTADTPPARLEHVNVESDGLHPAEVNDDADYRASLESRRRKLASLNTVTEDQLRNPPPADWLSWRRTDDGLGFSPLQQISKVNARLLIPAWTLALPIGTNEIIPLVHDGVIFLNSSGTVLAIDATNGDLLWKYVLPPSGVATIPPHTQPRSIAIFGDDLYIPTNDNHVVAVDFHTGKLIWDHLITGRRKSLQISGGPIVVHGKVIVGMSGCAGVGEPGGCFIAALDARTGEEVWRFNTIARPGEPNGDSWNRAPLDQRFGASVWSPGVYDAQDNLVLFGPGQTYHIASLMKPGGGSTSGNAALYTDTTLALDPDTGQLKWFYQHMARDVWDLDWAFERTVTTLGAGPFARRVVMTMGKLGILDILDVRTGTYVSSYDLGLQNLVTSIDPKSGYKSTNPALEPDPGRSELICPFATGVRNWPSTSYDPSTHLLYVPTVDACMDYQWVRGEDWDITYRLRARPGGDGRAGGLAAIDVATHRTVWWNKFRAPAATSTLATAGGVVFDGGRDRTFRASDSANGSILWRAKLDDVPSSTPITFTAGGEQFVAVTTGSSPMDAALAPLTPEIEQSARSTTLWVFKLHMQTGRNRTRQTD